MNVTERKRKHSPHQPVGRWIRVDKRLAIYLRDGFTCLLCGKYLHGADPRDVTLDHVKARIAGGTNVERNLFTCCRSCNSARQHKRLCAFASPTALKIIRRNVRRDLKRYLALARELIATGSVRAL